VVGFALWAAVSDHYHHRVLGVAVTGALAQLDQHTKTYMFARALWPLHRQTNNRTNGEALKYECKVVQ
jgi:hypothetical protein